jgi:hypothetical protein
MCSSPERHPEALRATYTLFFIGMQQPNGDDMQRAIGGGSNCRDPPLRRCRSFGMAQFASAMHMV